MKSLFKALGWPLGSARLEPAALSAAFLASCPDPVLVTEADGAVAFANDAARELFGCAAGVPLRRFPELLNAASFEAYRSACAACLAAADPGLPPLRLELTLHGPGGDRELELRLRACRADRRLFLVHGFDDVTERRRLEERMTRSRDFYLALLDHVPALVWRSGSDGGRNYFNRAWLRFSGRPMDAAFGDRWLDDVHPEDGGALSNEWRRALVERGPVSTEYRLRRADGNFRRIVEHAAPVFGPSGGFEGYVGVCQDVTDARSAQEETEAHRRAALQRAFVANVSHELRTPIAAIRGFAETLRRGAIDQPKVAGEFIETIDRHAQRLHRLIEDLLEISLLESGRLRPRPEPVKLSPFVWEFCERLAPAAERKKVRLRVDVDPELVVWIDPGQLHQVFENLCDNAIKFSPKGGAVSIEAATEQGFAVVTVRDTGPGIAPDQIPVLFDRFLRKATPSSKAAPTTGLGLTIVRGIVELYGGSIGVESSDRGAAFTFRVPLRPAREAPVSIVADHGAAVGR
ncbi:MAG: PAS domain-containing protein [Elusimicrobia bacterium]|nr:PAS domain-containing protein [Elusimicrobiota bacterium]